MSQVLLINPAKRRKVRSSGAKRRKAPSAAQRANWARFAAMARRKSAGSRARNPIKTHKRRAKSRRRNPIAVYSRSRRVTRRRRNPIGRSIMGGGLLNFRSYITPLKDAAVMGAGAVAVDVAFNYINRYLPASVQVVPGAVGMGDGVKAVLTVALGKLLSGPTRGLSQKAAMGSLVCQMRDITMKALPPSVTGAGLGFFNPGRVVPGAGVRASGNQRAIANGATGGVGMYIEGRSPLLGRVARYVTPGTGSPLLSRAR